MVRRRITRACLVVSLAVAVLGGPADAHTKRFHATVIVDQASCYTSCSFSFIAGHLEDARARCLGGRSWRVFRYPSNTLHFDSKVNAGSAERFTYPDGTFHSPMAGFSNGDQFYVVINKKVLRKNEFHRHICAKDVSAVYTYPYP